MKKKLKKKKIGTRITRFSLLYFHLIFLTNLVTYIFIFNDSTRDIIVYNIIIIFLNIIFLLLNVYYHYFIFNKKKLTSYLKIY